MSRFWMERSFVRGRARLLTVKAIAVFMALSCYANEDGKCFVGIRRLADDLGINKTTVTSGLRELADKGFITRRKLGFGRLEEKTVLSVDATPSDLPKRFYQTKESYLEYLKTDHWKNLRQKALAHQLVSPNVEMRPLRNV